jgi:transcriptional regulator with XRE-family HTH domain
VRAFDDIPRGMIQNNPSVAILKRLARALGVPVTELLE